MDCSTPGLPVHHQLLMSIEFVMPSNHLILCHLLLILPSIFLSIRVISNKSVHLIVVVFQSLSYILLCNPMDYSPPGFPALHYLPEFLRLMSIESVMLSNHPIFCCLFLLLLSIFPASGSFPMSQLFASAGQNIGTSASASVLLMNIQD